MPTDEALAAVDLMFERFVADTGAPGVAFGIVADGALIRHGAAGISRLDGQIPDADTPFRIASMTKSFTAMTVLALRDEGRLRLDDPASSYVPELAGWRRWSTDSPAITIRHLLTMTAGLPNDDPWGDRQQSLPLDAFATYLAGGASLSGPPGVRFEYSNLGYAILGRVVSAVTGREYGAAVRDRILSALGLSAHFDAGTPPSERHAVGYVRRGDAWLEQPVDGHGAFAPMGGLWASVRDLATWVGEFTDAFPARDDPEGSHPVGRATRREMQQAHVPLLPEMSWTAADAAPSLEAAGYAFGLFVLQDLALGRIVGHGGGYPGFGSHMRWHPGSGLGVVALANARYAPMGRLTLDALRILVPGSPERVRVPAQWPETTAARSSVERLIAGWDDAVADGLFAMNVDLDEPIADRQTALEKHVATHGTLAVDETEPAISRGPAHLEWWMRGDHGRVRVEILLDPQMPPRVQWLELASVPEPSARLVEIAERIVALLAGPDPAWPDDIALAASVDHVAVDRMLRAAEAGYGPVELGPALEGDGEKTATWRLTGARGRLSLRVALETPTGAVSTVAIVPASLEPPVEID